MSSFGSAWPILRAASAALRPPQRVSVSAGAQANLKIVRPGGYTGYWSSEETPYMVEPMDSLASRRHEAVAFVGPAQSGKTMGLVDGWFAYAVICDNGDMLIVQMTQEKARDFSKLRIDRAIRHSPKLRELMSIRGHDDNTHDKLFRHGMWVKIGWPSASQLSSTDYRYVVFTDYDRMTDNIDGEGSGFQLGLKRTTTFLSRGMCLVESSPGRDIEDPSWEPSSPHEAPPVTGVLGLYNRSDRRRWYWQCFDCRHYFEAAPGLSLFATIPQGQELIEDVRHGDLSALADHHCHIVCPHCGSMIDQTHKSELNSLDTARWVAEGQSVAEDGVVTGDPIASSIAGYWLGGVAATYQSWHSLLFRYFQGLREYDQTGSDLTLKGTINTDQGAPYLPQGLAADKTSKPEDRLDDSDRYIVPDEARFLIAAVDVQGGSDSRFVVEVRALGPHLESWLVDRYEIRTTKRGEIDSQVDPAAYPEDWDLLTEKVVTATYRTSGDKELRVYRTGVDTGGEKGTSPNAYAWLRKLRSQNLSNRVYLVKGGSTKQPEKPMIRGHARDNRGKPMRDLPLWSVYTDYYKDIVSNSLRRTAPGPNYFHPPKWVPKSYFDELRAEVRQPNGKWKQVRKRNEALDLWVYVLAVCEALGFGAKGKLKWDSPPGWALPLNSGGNTELITKEERRAEKASAKNPRRKVGKSDWSKRL